MSFRRPGLLRHLWVELRRPESVNVAVNGGWLRGQGRVRVPELRLNWRNHRVSQILSHMSDDVSRNVPYFRNLH